MSSRVGDETIRNVPLVTVSDPLLGHVVDQYKVESVVGTGAMGIVYRGVHEVIGKKAAIKVLKPDFADDPEMVQRLVREARTVNSIRHPAIVDIFGFGTLPRSRQPYIIMDLLEGVPLDEYLKEHAPMRVREMAPFIDELLSALAAAHAVGVIHRDLKPGNIFVESKPDGQQGIKVIDFGLAKQADRAGGSVKPTNPGTLLGTPAFMAPEQVLGTKVTPQTDLYAVGGIVYQMLTNHLPHEGPTAIDVLSQKMQHDPIRPRQWQPHLDEDLDVWVMNLLSREPEKRMKDADEARRALRRIVDGRTSGTSPVKPSSSGKNAALAATGVVPRRQWADAQTLTDAPPVKPQQSTTDRHVSPWDRTDERPMPDADALEPTHERPLPDVAALEPTHEQPLPNVDALEPTAAPLRSPFATKSPSRSRLDAVTVVGDATPVDAPVARRAGSQPKLAPVQEATPEDSTRSTDPAHLTSPAAPSNVPLYIALSAAIVALLLGLAYLFLR